MTKYIHIDDEFWDEIEDGENIVIYHNGNEENIVVPEELGGHPVTRIGKLKPTDEVKSITIPKTVTVIEDDAFAGFPEDFVIYCYPTTEYSNKDRYKIIYLEEDQQKGSPQVNDSEEEPVLEQAGPEEVPMTTEEYTSTDGQVDNESTIQQEVVITSTEGTSIVETTVETPIENTQTSDSNSSIFSAIIFIIALILIGVSFLLRGKK